ncbi:MAG: FAD-dependent oxidoreductase [Pseudomonadota bacterium]
MTALQHLFSPLNIKGMELKNRAVMPPMGTNLANADATAGEAFLAYLKRQAGSGAGLIIVEVTAVHPLGIGLASQLGAYDDRFIPSLRKIAQTIHEAGGKASIQLHHAGRESFYHLTKGQAVGPSAVKSLVYGLAPREMTKEEIKEVITSFGRAAARVKEAEFDAVEVHGAHGYLLMQFLSAISNQRTDEYGGRTVAERARFVLEVLAEVRRNVGENFPISLRVSAEEFIKNGYQVDDLVPVLPDMVTAGADIIHASLGTHGSPGGVSSAPPEYEPGFNVWRAKRIKESVNAVVIAVGRFSDPALADEVIARGEADLVAFGRQQLADPDYLIKAQEGRSRDIRRCLACNQGCIDRLLLENGTVRCSINPETGQELIYPQGPAPQRRRVWIIGAGPAGLTAAYEAKRLGHEVRLFEKEDKAGGGIFFAGQAPFKTVYAEWISWLIGQVESLGVKIETGTAVTEEMLEEARPEAVILATGAEKVIPPLPGIDRPLVTDAWRVLAGEAAPRKNVVVVGGGLIGMEMADFMLARGSRVTLVEQLSHSPVTKFTAHGYMLHKRLRDGGCRMMFNTKVESIGEDSVTVTGNGQTETLTPVEQVVLAVGMKPRDDLKKALAEKGLRHFIVGDASQVRRIIEATEEGARAAWEI